MIVEDMIHGGWRGVRPGARRSRPPRHRIEDDTPILPRVVAEAVWAEASVYLHAELPRAWVRRLVVRADMVYHHNAKFRRLLRQNGNAGRDWLWSFTRHWLAAMILRHQPELYARLPAAYSTGHEPSGRDAR